MDIFNSIIAIVVLALFIYLTIKRPGTALLVYIPLCIGYFLLAIFFDEVNISGHNIAYLASAIIIFLITPLFVWLWGGDQFKDHWKRTVGKVIFLSMLGLGGVALCFPAFMSLVGVYFIFFLAFLAVSIGSFVKSTKNATLAFVITTIGASLRQNLPLPAALYSAATGQPYTRKIILEKIADWITQGFSLTDSLKNGYPKLPANILSQIRQAEKINQLPQAIKSIEDDLVREADESKNIGPIKPFLYVAMVFLIACLITTGLSLFVMPKFAEVMRDFSSNNLPPATTALMSISDYMFFRGGRLIVLGIFILMLISIVIDARTRFRKRNPEKPFLTSKIKDWIRWHTPIIHWYEFNYSALSLVELLRHSVNAGIPTDQAFKNSTNLDLNFCFKKRLIKLSGELEQGHNVASSIIIHKLPKPIAWAYQSANDQERLGKVFELLENFYRSNYSYMVNMAKYILTPLSVVTIGIFVGFICYAIFSPIVLIINTVADLVP
jgi:type IV pilus assembly protein PilC